MNKNDICLSQKEKDQLMLSFNLIERLTLLLAKQRWVHLLAKLYTSLLDEKVTSRQTVFFLYAQLAATTMLLPYYEDLGWRACCFILFCLAISKTRTEKK